MIRSVTAIVLQCMVLSAVVLAQTANPSLKSLQRIVPLMTDRDDILEMLGQPIESPRSPAVWIYDFSDSRMMIIFEIGNCVWQEESQTWSGWNVPEGTVVSVSLWFEKPISPSKLGIDLKKLHKTKIGGDRESYEYSDVINGRSYNVNSGKILDIEKSPRSDQKDLKCRTSAP